MSIRYRLSTPSMKLFYLFLLSSVCLHINFAESDENVYELSDFVVTGSEDKGYYSANSTSITKANELVKNTPVNLTVINEELLQDLGINTTEDLAQVSASIDTDPTSYSLDQIRIRGFRNTHARYNGFRRSIPRDSYNTSRIDIIKGANSLIFGQASPGGSVNTIPAMANFRKDAGSIIYAVGNKGYDRKVFNYNKVISDQLAIRFMALDHFQGYEHNYKKYDLESQTLSLNLRPNSKNSLLLHIENVDAQFNFPSLAMRDNTFIDDSDAGGNMMSGIKYDGYLSVSENNDYIRDYHVPFTSEWLSYVPQAFIDNLIIYTQNNAGPYQNPDGSGIKIESNNDLINYYSTIDETNYGYQSGPDKNKRINGTFITAELQSILSENLELNLALNYQNNTGENLARDSYGSTRIIDSYTDFGDYPRTHFHVYDLETGDPDQYIRTYWTKTEASGDRKGAKATLLWEKNIKKVENKFLFGWDYEAIDKKSRNYDQTFASALNTDGSYKTSETYNADDRHTWVTNGKITDRELAFEYIDISKGFGPDRSIIQFNDIVENDFYYPNFNYTHQTGFYRTDPNSAAIQPTDLNNALFTNGVRDEKAIWGTNSILKAKVTTNSQWLAAQSSFLNGRLRTLVGARLDNITVSSSIRKVSIYGYENNSLLHDSDGDGLADDAGIASDLRVNNSQKEKYSEISPSIGALYWLNKNYGIFGNFAQSIETPTGEERTPTGELAPPELGKGFEAGMRFTDSSGKVDGQLAFYSIEKENDSEFSYSDNLLNIIYDPELINPKTGNTYGDDYPENYNETTGRLLRGGLPGRRAVGDITLSQGFEIDLNYNPTQTFSIIASFNKTVKNEIKKLNDVVQNPEEFELFGRPKYRATLTGRYSFKDGPLRGLTLGLSQQYRSGSEQTKFNFYFDENNNQVNQADSIRSETYYLKFPDEYNTIAFLNYKGKFGNANKPLRYNINFRINNLFDTRQFINRNNYGFYRESRSYTLSAKISF